MNIHLIRTEDYTTEELFAVYDFLMHFHPEYKFCVKEKPFTLSLEEELDVWNWDNPKIHRKASPHTDFVSEMSYSAIHIHTTENLFGLCNQYRKKHRLKDDDIVILLTEYGNDMNWFSMGDPENKGNIFIHTAVWDYYTGVDQRYAVGYQIVSALLKYQMFESLDDALPHFHKVTRGCMMDFCEDKKQISIKMRTADICGDCQKIIQSKNIPHANVIYTLNVMEFIRKQILHRSRYQYLQPEKALEIRGYMKKVYLPQLGSKEVNLTAMERTVYLLFLNHEEGIRISEISNYRAEISELLHRLSNSDNREVIETGIDKLCAPSSNSLSEKMARIRQKFVEELGEEEAKAYIISGPNGSRKKIALPRQFVSRNDN
jgi:hypothetical protein